jgi:hypothetical protein
MTFNIGKFYVCKNVMPFGCALRPNNLNDFTPRLTILLEA